MTRRSEKVNRHVLHNSNMVRFNHAPEMFVAPFCEQMTNYKISTVMLC